MAGNRQFENSKLSGMSFWKSASASSNSNSQSSSATVDQEKMMEEELIASFKSKVSVHDTMCAVLTESNSNFDALCSQLGGMEISIHRNNTLKQASIVANLVEQDLNRITQLHGPAKTEAEEDRRFLIVQVVQAYIRCLELDVEKWKHKLKLSGKSDAEIGNVSIVIREFSEWDKRKHTAPAYNQDRLEKPSSETIVDQISFVQAALNYWRSAYHYIGEYEKLIGASQYEVEKRLWHLEQTTISYLSATENVSHADINLSRLREPRSLDSEGNPLSVRAIQGLIQQQQERSGYQLK